MDIMPKKKKGTGTLPFKNILADVMKSRRLTLKEVADLAGVSVSVVDSWLSGSVPHDLMAISNLAARLGLPFKKLLLGQSETIDAPTAISDLFEEQDFFEGLVRIKIQRLMPKKPKE